MTCNNAEILVARIGNGSYQSMKNIKSSKIESSFRFQFFFIFYLPLSLVIFPSSRSCIVLLLLLLSFSNRRFEKIASQSSFHKVRFLINDLRKKEEHSFFSLALNTKK